MNSPASPSFSLSGKVVIQFGGTGNLGRALVSALAAAGATLVVATRDKKSVADSVAGEIQAGHAVTAEEVDICSEPSLHGLRDRVLAAHQRVDGVVFNAVSRPMSGPDDALAKWESSMAVNATGFFATARVFADAMAARGAGSIVAIASMQGMVGPNFWLYEGTAMTAPPDYFFHKAGMINLSRYLASRYGPRGVRVNAVSPGGILNPAKPPPDEFLSRYGKMTLLERMALAPEICGAVVFLLSDAASYITAINLPVDGGYTAK
ncbi:MAG: SDR family oxidoreductase [Opitutaceae bacterium]|nr:SDR family oxidoreductase [Opitutaceae bacterium]